MEEALVTKIIPLMFSEKGEEAAGSRIMQRPLIPQCHVSPALLQFGRAVIEFGRFPKAVQCAICISNPKAKKKGCFLTCCHESAGKSSSCTNGSDPILKIFKAVALDSLDVCMKEREWTGHLTVQAP